MASSKAYEIRLAKDAARQLRNLGKKDGRRARDALYRQAERCASSAGSRGGKALKQIQGRRDRFFRLRVGEFRIVFDQVDADRVLLVHGIVNRRDLERWLRRR